MFQVSLKFRGLKNLGKGLLSFGLVWGSTFAAQATSVPKPLLPEGARVQPDISDPPAWIAHLAEAHYQPIQKACQPFFLPAQGVRRGTLLLFHGFSACPQQFWGLAPQLAAQGFAVYAPLLSGHGRQAQGQPGAWQDTSTELPGEKDWQRYQRQALQLAELMPSEGLRVVGGLSVGAAVAASALIQAPQSFDRGILLTTLFDVNRPQSQILPLISPLVPDFNTDWGPGCELEREGGRGGYCQFRLRHLRAVQRLGQETLAQLNQIQVPVQIVGVEDDGTASNSAQFEAHRRLSQSQICFFQKGANHSLFSRYDSPQEDKFWLAALERMTVAFVQTGQYFHSEEQSEGRTRCSLK